jgi:putative transposase
MPSTSSAVIRAAKKNLWPSRTKVRGKGCEYEVRVLPDVTRNYILHLAIDSATAAKAAVAASGFDADEVKSVIILKPGTVAVRGQIRRKKDDGALTSRDLAYRDSAIVLCRAIEGAMSAADCSVKKACQELASRLVVGDARPELLAAAQETYIKPRKDAGPLGGVTALFGRLQRMFSFFDQGRLAGDVGMYLVPGKREKTGHNPIHVAAFLRFFCHPSRPPVSEAYRKMKPWLEERSLDIPSYSTVCRIEDELPVTVKYRGRVTGSEWRSLKTYIERDVSMFHANDIWVGDGHSFKAKVQHPIHGQPFTPEITVIIDWVSRKIVGWSVALSESTIAVSDAFRHAQMTTRARPLVYYSDNGSGQTGKMIDCPIAGTLARQCIGHETGIPGNPQARGIIERLWQVTFVALAREYPTCTWRGADDNATTKMLKLLNRKDQGGITIPSFRQLLDDVERVVNDYNLHHEHRELNGRTPEDEYQARIDKDSIVFGPTDTEIHALWMPEVVRKPQRGLISIFGNTYCKRDLVSVLPEGSQVRVRYDLHNPEKVWLLTLDGVYLGEAAWNGHRVAAFPISEMERKRAERAAGKVKRGEKIIAEAQAELGDVIEMAPAVALPVMQADYLPLPVVEEGTKEEAPVMSHEDMVMWLYGQKDQEDGETPSSEEAAG